MRDGPARMAMSWLIVRTHAPMNLLSTAFLAFAMSTDAFAAAVGKGAALHKPRWRDALRVGLIFGVIEAITPVAGWALGLAAADYVAAWDHWIAFVLLVGLGAHMVIQGCRRGALPEEARPSTARHSFWTLAITGFATSIDAMAVGVGLAFIDANIVSTAAAIGMATLLMVTLGIMLGRVLGRLAGARAEIIGGIILAGIGCVILYEHLSAAAG